MSKEKSSIGFGLGLLAGVVGGIVAGILYAPCPGSEMREKVKDTVCDLAEKYSPEVEDAKKQAMESVDLLKYKLERQYYNINLHLWKKICFNLNTSVVFGFTLLNTTAENMRYRHTCNTYVHHCSFKSFKP